METKRCPRCGRTKRVALFYSNAAQRDGLSTQCKSCMKRYKRDSYDADRRRWWRLRAYGVDDAWVAATLAKQHHQCAVCLAPDPVCVDHDHETGVARGMLCQTCNRAIGLLHDDIDTLVRAQEYLCR